MTQNNEGLEINFNQCNFLGPHGAICRLNKNHEGNHWGQATFSWSRLIELKVKNDNKVG